MGMTYDISCVAFSWLALLSAQQAHVRLPLTVFLLMTPFAAMAFSALRHVKTLTQVVADVVTHCFFHTHYVLSNSSRMNDQTGEIVWLKPMTSAGHLL